jgi:hypothetical protein
MLTAQPEALLNTVELFDDPAALQQGPLADTTTADTREHGWLEPTQRALGRIPTSQVSKHRMRNFESLQTMRGMILDVEDKFLRVKLVELGNPSATEEIASLPIRAIDPEDRELLESGTVFYWTIGLERRGDSTASISEFRVLRYPRWTQVEIDSIRREGHALFQEIMGSSANAPTGG